MTRPCSVDGCVRPAKSRGWCNTHYERWRRNGDLIPRKTPPMHGASVLERAEAKMDRNGPLPDCAPELGACWLWTASLNRSGYAVLDDETGKTSLGHRLVYRVLVGEIPDGLTLDHLCRVRHCVNPAHLEPVTAAENARRGLAGEINRTKTHCPQGHPYDDENTYRDKRRGFRYCRECGRERVRARRALAKAGSWRLPEAS